MKKIFTKLTSFTLLFCLIQTASIFNNTSMVYASGTVYLYQDFENTKFPPAGWTLANTASYNWVRTTYCSGYGIGGSCAVIDFYDLNSGSFDMITPTFPATTTGDSLSFDHAYTCGSSENDNMSIFTSTNGGSTWTLLINLAGGPSGPLTTAPPTYDLFIPHSNQWATKRYLLPLGTNSVKFTGYTAFGNNLYLDNIRVGSPYTNDVGANAILSPKWGITPASIGPIVSVRNFGTATESFSVNLTITPGSYSNNMNVTNLASGQTQQLTFPSFNFSTNGNYTLKAATNLSGDQNPVNDSISSIVVVTPAPRIPVLEFCTGTWCQWCACGDKVADTLSVRYPNSLIFAYHGGSDPYINFNGNNIITLMGWNGYPEGNINRRGPGVYESGWGNFFYDAELDMASNPSSTINTVITNKTYNTSTRVLSVNLNATALQNLNGTFNINYTVTENNLVYSQSGNSYCAGASNWVHNWVTRNIVNGATGENISTGTWNSGTTISKSFNTTLDNAWVSGNCKINIFIYNATNGTNISATIQSGIKDNIDLTGINQQGTTVPKQYVLNQNYPNPFNPSTNIHFGIPKDENVSFKIYDVTGRLVETYLDGFIKAGYYNVEVDASKYASGVYFYTLLTKDFVQTKKMILVK